MKKNFMLFRFLIIILQALSISGDGLTLISYPINSILTGSSQIISWNVPTGVILKTVKVDIYQSSQYRQTLGVINNNAKSFNWEVSPKANKGIGYAIRVTGTSTEGNTAWATSPSFSIVSSDNTNSNNLGVEGIVGIVVIMLATSSLCYCVRNKRTDKLELDTETNYHTMQKGIPVANPYPINPTNPNYPTNFTRTPMGNNYSGTSVAGAAVAGLATGVILDEVINHRNRVITDNSNFGGGTFGDGGDFSGGDNSCESGGNF